MTKYDKIILSTRMDGNKNNTKGAEGMDTLIRIENGEQLVSARDLHEALEVTERFSKWFDRMLSYGFEKNVDFVACKKVCAANQYGGEKELDDYDLKLDAAKEICRKQRRNKKAGKLLEYFMTIDNKEIIIIEPERKEIEFGKMLDVITGFEWQKQYSIDNGKYRLDFYLEDVLIVEYDEKYHEYQKEEDEKRINYCRDWLATHKKDSYDDGWRCPVIRIKEGEELNGLNRIIRHLAGFELFDTQYNYNLDVCDIKNK
jgi:phage anti-repressor protein/very-short-patch-repair endonuclease